MKDIKDETEIILTNNDIEVMVTYDMIYNEQIEDFHGIHDLSYYDVKLKNVEIVIGGRSVDILPQLTLDQENVIIGNLSIH